jgi:DNA polymerase
LPEEVREVLEIRQKLGKSSIAKYSAMVDCECADSRARGLFQFYGANHTGRWAGRSIQLQNLPRNYIESIGYARELVKAEDRDSIELMYGDVQDTLSQLLRTALIPSEGCEFVIADYSAIECRVLAWLAGEESTLDAFRNGEDIYCHTASRMYGVPVVKHGENGELRQKGKQATLACGYGGGVNALRAMGAKGTDSELQPLVDYWRRANPNVVKYWAEVERAAKFAMRTGETAYAKHVTFRYETDDKSGLRFLTLELPSGRKLFYCNPRFKTNRFGGTSIAYDAQRTAGWGETETYAGKWVENIVQGVARDLLMNALENIEKAGYTVVSHVHDEVIVDAPKGSLTVDALGAMMCKLPEWADTSLPLEAAGFVSEYYMKD